MTTAWTRTREQLAADILLKLRLIAPGDTPDSAVLTVVYAAMDARLKELHALGMLPWKLTTAPVNVAIPAPTVIITGTAWSGGVATFKSTAHGLVVGQSVTIAGVVSSSGTYQYNGTFIIATVADANTFTVPMVNNPGTWTSGGTAVGSVIIAVTDMLYPLMFNLTIGGYDYEVAIVSNQVYQGLAEKASSGRPNTCYFDGAAIYLAPQPDMAYTGKLTYQKIMDDTAVSTAPDVLPGAMKCLTDILAGDLADGLAVDDARYASIKSEAGTLDGPRGPTGAFRRLLMVISRPQTILPMKADYF